MREFWRHFRIYFLVTVFMNLVFMFIRSNMLAAYGVSTPEAEFEPLTQVLFYTLGLTVSGGLLALLLSIIDVALLRKILHKKSLAWVFVISVAVHSVIVGFLIRFMNGFMTGVIDVASGEELVDLPPNENVAWIALIFLNILIARLIIEVDQKLGPGNLWKMITGRFYKPREDQRIFMFIDLKSSTTIAEQLGHRKYSLFLQDCFNDLTVVSRYNAEVYQYVGDEVIISWSAGQLKNYHRFLQAFFAFREVLEGRRSYYIEEYGLFPEFKAGAHVGPAIVTEVGQIKREITYHGDTLNTTARIQGKCNELKAELLVSDKLYSEVDKVQRFEFEDVGCIQLKGKEKELRLFRVSA